MTGSPASIPAPNAPPPARRSAGPSHLQRRSAPSQLRRPAAIGTTGGALRGLMLAWLVALGRETRVVELTRPGDAGGRDAAATDGVTCDLFVRDDGIACRICFSDSGAITSMSCEPAPTVPGPPLPMCRVVRADGGTYMACLRCDPPAPSSAGGQCRTCAWSDDGDRRCVQCFAANGALREDNCDEVRGGSMSPPSGPDAGMTPLFFQAGRAAED